MSSIRRLAVASLSVTFLHLVFGGIVRITGSGMGCGDHWPKCNGSWVPPFTDPTVLIEWIHRLLALVVVLAIAALAIAVGRRRTDAEVVERRMLRPVMTALVLVIVVALVGMVTVKLGNTTFATVSHWTLAMALLGTLVVAAVRAGALGGDTARRSGGTPRAVRSLGAGAALAFVIVVLGGIVAKYPGAGVACPSFPHCGATPADVPAGAAHLQLTHRVLAYLLVFHLLAGASSIGRRASEAPPVKRATRLAAGLVLLQVAIGAGMVLALLPPALRMLHQLVGIAVWMTVFTAAYLARAAATAQRTGERGARTTAPSPVARPLSPQS